MYKIWWIKCTLDFSILIYLHTTYFLFVCQYSSFCQADVVILSIVFFFSWDTVWFCLVYDNELQIQLIQYQTNKTRKDEEYDWVNTISTQCLPNNFNKMHKVIVAIIIRTYQSLFCILIKLFSSKTYILYIHTSKYYPVHEIL